MRFQVIVAPFVQNVIFVTSQDGDLLICFELHDTEGAITTEIDTVYPSFLSNNGAKSILLIDTSVLLNRLSSLIPSSTHGPSEVGQVVAWILRAWVYSQVGGQLVPPNIFDVKNAFFQISFIFLVQFAACLAKKT
jgi:hypothetical protein